MLHTLLSAARIFCRLNQRRGLVLLATALGLAGCPVAAALAQRRAPVGAADSLRGLLQKRSLPDSARLRLLRLRSAVLFNSHHPAESIAEAEQVVRQAQKMHDWNTAGHWLYNLFLYCERFGDNVAALKHCQRGLAFVQTHQLPYEWLFYQGLGMVATDSKDYAAGLRYLRSAYFQQLRVPAGQVRIREKGDLLINLAITFLAVQQPDSALKYAVRALPLLEQLGDPRGLAYVYSFKGQVFQTTKPQTAPTLDSAAANVNRSLQILLRHHFESHALGEAIELADIHRQQGRPAAAQQMAELALKLARQLKMPQDKMEALFQLAWAQADQGRYRASYDVAAQAEALRDSLFNDGKAQALAQLQVRFGVQQQQQRLRLLAEQNRVAEARTAAAGAHVQLLTQQSRVAAAQQQVQRTRLALLGQQGRAAAAEAQAQRVRVQLLTQRNHAAAARQRAQQARLRWLGAGLALLSLGLLLGWLLYLRLRRSSRLLAAANRQISAAVAEKEVLLQEIHHRVKNNLQLVSSLLGWQRSALPDATLGEALAGSQARIQSMALVHEFLYRADDLAQVRLDTYLTELLDSLHQSLTTPQCAVRLTTDLAPVVMEAKDATAFGLVVNELVTNAYKHAFSQQRRGHLHVALAARATGFHLSVLDDGAGLPATGTAATKSASLGMQLVQALATQLKATVTATPRFPLGTRMEVTCA